MPYTHKTNPVIRKRKRRGDAISLFFVLCMVLIVLLWFRVRLHLPILSLPIYVLSVLWFFFLVVLVFNGRTSTRRTFHRAPQLNEIDQMTGEDFEDALKYTLKKKGWQLQTTNKTGDFGADLIGTAPWKKTYVIQAKRYKSKVGVSAVQEVIAALVITNNYLTRPARELAQEAQVEIWERGRLTREGITHSSRGNHQ